jgi:hypothetical protein
MNEFLIYLKLGFSHISDVKGFDHILFIITLCAVYKISEWKKVGLLVTAFTIGHSVTLALSALKIIVFNASLIELLIPITIFFTSISNLFYKISAKSGLLTYNYGLALVFGFVHGMGFSNFFNALMGDSGSIIFPLFAFNLGLELGQLLIVVAFFSLYFLIGMAQKVNHKAWTQFFSGAGAGVSLVLIIERI